MPFSSSHFSFFPSIHERFEETEVHEAEKKLGVEVVKEGGRGGGLQVEGVEAKETTNEGKAREQGAADR